MEAHRLRVKDLVMDRGELIVRDAKGGRDRVTVLPAAIIVPLREHLAKLFDRFEHERKLREPGVSLPSALVRKYPNAATQWAWQWLFGRSQGEDPAAGELSHLSPLLCDASSRGRPRHSHGAGIAGACRCAHHHGLHACNGKGGDGGKKPPGPAALRHFLRLATSAAIP
jgi:hypothetical protein